MKPMLAEVATPAQVQTNLLDPRWCAQLKCDGDRLLVEVLNGKVTAYGRSGGPKISGMNEKVMSPFRKLPAGRWVFDGELVSGKLWLFDMPAAPGVLSPSSTFEDRYTVLVNIVKLLEVTQDAWEVLPVAWSAEEKLTLLQKAEADHREGIILKRISGRYTEKRSSDMLKHKFVKDADVIVTAVGTDGKSNATLSILKDGKLMEVGRASTIGKKPGVEVGDVWTARYLYMVDPSAPRMYQPRLICKRTDKAATECEWAQFADGFTNKVLV